MGDSGRILVVEDDADQAELVRRIFAGHPGYRLEVAPTLQAAREAVARAVPALVFADVRLPDGSGLELLADAPQGEQPFPVVVMTAHGDQAMAVEAMKTGALDYVAKSEAALFELPRLAERSLREWEHLASRRRMEEALRHIARGTAGVTGEDFFASLGRYLATALGARYALVAEALDTPVTRVRTLSFWCAGREGERFEYGLAGTPCADVYGQGRCFYAGDVQARFPNDEVLRRLEVVSYLGIALPSSGRHVLGHLAIMDDRPMDDRDLKLSMAEIFAARAGAELERRRAEQTLLESSRLVALGQLAAGLAHELNQPLTAISAVAQGLPLLVQRGIPVTKEQQLEWCQLVQEQVARMTDLIEHLRVFSRVHSQEAQSAVAINAVVHGALQMLGAQLRDHGVDVRLELGERVPPVLGNRYRLEQVVLNLLSNARDALDEEEERQKQRGGPPDAKVLYLRTAARDGRVRLEVEDTGTGMGPQTRERLFQPFFTAKGVDRGTGLGLSIAYAIVKAHRGEIECRSAAGEGTLFRVSLPACVGAPREGWCDG